MFPGSDALIHKIKSAVAALSSQPTGLGVAVSGGADSAMLAVAAAQYAAGQGLALHLFHVHHGLQATADEWLHRVHDLAHQLAVPCHSMRVTVSETAGYGIEAAARDARYKALHDMARVAGVRHILLGHHLHDQAETVLLRLLRGAGPVGLAAMSPHVERDGIEYVRPWLDVDRAQIVDAANSYAAQTGWQYVTDPTNAQDRYTRAAVRERLAPTLDARWPGWRDRLARHARQSAQAAQVLDEVACADLMSLDFAAADQSFSLASWRLLSEARQALVLRYWLGQQRLAMPTDARLHNLMRQMRQLHALGFDRAMRVGHGPVDIVCQKGRVFVAGRHANDDLNAPCTGPSH
ncbi:tRNA lysidine(34) synthetase TilS [Pusillimonas sp. T2]|uniref:tRNA lysidine(34) synthetase TilS n=1 Tax=Pusillimonas sp. T2 TaxID=1548123 RepID=UPI000B94662E|nr:tRNA lysidine(34) synthetase TilS [Pusillimonas sp. T2]